MLSALHKTWLRSGRLIEAVEISSFLPSIHFATDDKHNKPDRACNAQMRPVYYRYIVLIGNSLLLEHPEYNIRICYIDIEICLSVI